MTGYAISWCVTGRLGRAGRFVGIEWGLGLVPRIQDTPAPPVVKFCWPLTAP